MPADRAGSTAPGRGSQQPPARRGARRDDLLAGGTFVAIGLAFLVGGLGYELGTAFNMGPGYVPVVLGGLLVGLGLLVVAEGVVASRRPGGAGGAGGTGVPDASGEPDLGVGQEKGPVPWGRGALLLLALLLFGVLVDGLGLGPTLFLSTFLTALAGWGTGVLRALAIAVGLTAVSLLIFVVLLQLRLPLLGEWLGG